MKWLGTAFFSVLNASFFCVLLKNTTFFYCTVYSFFEFLATYETQKNVKESKEHNNLLQRTKKNAENVTFFYILFFARFDHFCMTYKTKKSAAFFCVLL